MCLNFSVLLATTMITFSPQEVVAYTYRLIDFVLDETLQPRPLSTVTDPSTTFRELASTYDIGNSRSLMV